MLLFLGTHRDKLHKCDTETVEDKNERLKKIIPPKFENQIIWLDTKKLIFEINALNPDDTLQKLKVTLTNKCSYLSCIHLVSYTLDMSKMCRMFISVSFSL